MSTLTSHPKPVVRVSLPPLCERRRAVVEPTRAITCAWVPPLALCDVGLGTDFMGRAVARALEPSSSERALFVTDRPLLWRSRVARWTSALDGEARSMIATRLVIARHESLLEGHDLPFERPTAAFIEDVTNRRCSKEVVSAARSLLGLGLHGPLVMTASPVGASHWYRQLLDALDACCFEQLHFSWRDVPRHPHELTRLASESDEPWLWEGQFPPERRRGPKPLVSFARDRLWVRTKQGPVVRFDLWDDQKRYLALRRLEVLKSRAAGRQGTQLLVLKSRRRGITTVEQADAYALCTRMHEARCLTLAQTDTDSTNLFAISKLFAHRDAHAPGLQPTGNQRMLRFIDTRSEYSVVTAGARAPARGMTLNKVHGSEVAWWCNRDIEAVDRLTVGLLEAASHGLVVYETTPNGEEWFASKWRDSKAGRNDWGRIFLRWFDDPNNSLDVGVEAAVEVMETLTDEEADLVRLHGLSAGQLAWRRATWRRLHPLGPQEYPEDDASCFLSSGTVYFNVDEVFKRIRVLEGNPTRRKPLTVNNSRGYSITWEDPQPGVQYVIGVDTSEGIPGCDPNGLIVKRKDTGRDVFAVHGYFKPRDLAVVTHAAHVSYNKAVVGVERENHGHAVILGLQSLGLRSARWLYHFKPGHAGWSTNEVTRPLMLQALSNTIDECPESFMDAELLEEALVFRLQKNGRFEADPGKHDDAVMKHAVAIQMLKTRGAGRIRSHGGEDEEEDTTSAPKPNGSVNGHATQGVRA